MTMKIGFLFLIRLLMKTMIMKTMFMKTNFWKSLVILQVKSQCGDAEECHHNSLECRCGGSVEEYRINILNSDLYCCVPPPKDESWCWSYYCDFDEAEIISKSLPCQGYCYNDYKIHYNATLGPQAMFQCESGEECVRV